MLKFLNILKFSIVLLVIELLFEIIGARPKLTTLQK